MFRVRCAVGAIISAAVPYTPGQEEAVSVGDDIFPVFVVRPDEPGAPIRFMGTGFIAAPRVFVTSWQVVRDELEEGQRYAAARRVVGGYEALHLSNITQDLSGRDLAIASIDRDPTLGLSLPATIPRLGADALAWGYPLVRNEVCDDRLWFRLSPRYLQGYITRAFIFESRQFSDSVVYELDMPAPEGMTGAPLVRLGTNELLGVVFGELEVPPIALASGGQAQASGPVSFAIAHHTQSIADLSGPATEGAPLSEYLQAR